MGFLLGHGPVFDATRYDQEFAFLQPDVAISELDAKPPLMTRNILSSFSWWCHTKGPWNLIPAVVHE
jgi:hypothetical protein